MDTLGWVFVGVVCVVCAFFLICIAQDALLRRAARKETERRAAHEKLMQDEKEYWARERAKRSGVTSIHRGILTAQNACNDRLNYHQKVHGIAQISGDDDGILNAAAGFYISQSIMTQEAGTAEPAMQGGGGTFDGAGASGDWERCAPSECQPTTTASESSSSSDSVVSQASTGD